MFFDKSMIVNALDRVNSSIASNRLVPILTNCRFLSKDGILRIYATDLQHGVYVVVGESSEDFEVLLSTDRVYNVLKHFPEGDIEFKIESGKYSFSSGGSHRFQFQAMDVGDYPNFPQGERSDVFGLSRGELERIVRKLGFLCSNNHMGLKGILFDCDGDGNLIAVAADGHRMGIMKISKGLSNIGMFVLSLPFLKKALTVLSGDVKFSVDERHCDITEVKEEGLPSYVTGRFLELDYPNYRSLIPNDFAGEIKFDRDEFHRAVKILSPIADELTSEIKFNCKDGIMTLTSGSGVGVGNVDIDVHGGCGEIGFNARHLSEIMGVMGEEVTMHFQEDLRSAVVFEGSEIQIVTMPLS